MFLDANTNDVGGALGVIVIIALIAAGYFLPTLIAWGRHHRTGSVFLVNLLVGWSLIGWIVSLVMAVGQKEQRVVVTHVTASAELPKA
jgi:hypothetical protein